MDRPGLRRAALALGVATLLVACSREAPPADAPPTPPPVDAATTPRDVPPLPAPEVQRRRFERAQAGWHFRLATVREGQAPTVLDVEAVPPDGRPPVAWQQTLEGHLADAFATDLDANGQPELLFWTRGDGSSAEGDVSGWRLLPDGGRAPLALPSLAADHALGWRGRDQFGLQGDVLVRSFPLYREDDDNASPTSGFVRVIRYRFDGEDLRFETTSLEPIAGSPQALILDER